MNIPMHEFRVTKYDPAARDSRGAYMKDEWTAYSDIGSKFAGVVFTKEHYLAVENAYVESAISFMDEAGISTVTVAGLENYLECRSAPVEGVKLDHHALAEALRHVLREEFWCRFEAPSGFIHIGHDYYMFIGVTDQCETTRESARRRGLFVERFESPCKD